MTKAAFQMHDDDRALRAAAKLFRQKGFAATTVREIAREAGMLPGSLHYRFASKDELLLALMEQGVSAAMRAVQQTAGHEKDPVERLRLGIRAHLQLLLSGDDAVFVLLYDWRSLKGDARRRMVKLRDGYERFWDQMLKDAVATGRARKGIDVPLMRLFGFGALNWVATWYREGKGHSPEDIADAFFDVMAFGLLAEDARAQTPRKKGGPRVRVPASRP